QGAFHPFWVDNRTGTSQLWSAPVTVRGTVAKNGGGELASMADITTKVTLELDATTYDRSSNGVTVRARLKNSSKDTLRGPIVVRVLRVHSDIGTPSVVGADNGREGEGATLSFTSTLPGGGLLPDSMGTVKELHFRISDVKPFHQGNDFKFGI